MPTALSSLLHRTRAAVLAVLLVVLPLQSVVQWMAGAQGHRHVHTGAADTAFTRLAQPLRALLDQLHAGQDSRLKHTPFAWLPSGGPAAELHSHGGVVHQHAHDDADVRDMGDPAGDTHVQGGATLFLAWLPAAVAVPAGQGERHTAAAPQRWRSRATKPLLTPPRG